MKLEKQFGEYSPAEAQKILTSMPYDREGCERDNYQVISAQQTLEHGSALCINGAIFGAALTGVRPRLLSMYSPTLHGGHTILLLEKNNLYGTIGKSRDESFQERDIKFDNIEGIVKSYNIFPFYSDFFLDDIVPNWINTKNNMKSDIFTQKYYEKFRCTEKGFPSFKSYFPCFFEER